MRELRNRSCGDSLLVKASKIPRESVTSIPPTCRTVSSKCQRRIEAPCISDQATRANQRDSSANARARSSNFPRELEVSPRHHADIVFLTMSEQLFSGTIARIVTRSKNQLLPRSLIERVKVKRLCSTATHVSGPICLHPEGLAPRAEP